MNPILRTVFFLVLATLVGGTGAARNPDGTLGFLKLPNNGVPVIIRSDAAFEAVLEKEATLTLSGGGGTTALEVSWSSLPGGLQQGRCKAPGPLSPGVYALHAETASSTDINTRSVYVVDTFPESYQIAHITDLHLGRFPESHPNSGLFQEIIETVNTSDAVFALITGDVTDNAEPVQFRQFLEQLDRCRLPTFVVAGNHDRTANTYQRFFGSSAYTFTFGEDGYLAFDTKDFLIADEMSAQNGLLYSYRRQIRAGRWSIGFTHRYDVAMGMRAQLCLFVDDPLDFLIYGHYHREPGEGDGIPWGTTRPIMTPAAVDGMMRFLQVNASGVKALETLTLPADTGEDH